MNYRSTTVATIGGEVNPKGAISPIGDIFGIKGYALVDLRAGVGAPNDRWRAWIWGKNVFNKYYRNNVVAAFDTIKGMPAALRLWGKRFVPRLSADPDNSEEREDLTCPIV